MKKHIKNTLILIFAIILLITGCSGGSGGNSENIIQTPTTEEQQIIQLKNSVPSRDIIKESIIDELNKTFKDTDENTTLSNSPKKTLNVTGQDYFVLSSDSIQINSDNALISYKFLYIKDIISNPTEKFTGKISYYFIKQVDIWTLNNIEIEEIDDLRLGQISGTVLNELTEEPIEGAVVYGVSGDETTKSVETDSNGSFIITDVIENTYNIYIFMPGFDRKEYKAITVEEDNQINLNNTFGDIYLKSNPNSKYVTLEGSIFISDGSIEEPVRNATVYILNSDNSLLQESEFIRPCSTDIEGNYQLKFVPHGNFKLIVKIQNNILAETTLNITENQVRDGNIIYIDPITLSNHAPVISASYPSEDSINLEVHESIEFKVNASDADNDELFYFWSCSDGLLDLSFDNSVSWVSTRTGTYTVKVKITDKKGGETEKTFNINVTNTNNKVEYMIIKKGVVLNSNQDNEIEVEYNSPQFSNLMIKLIIPANTFDSTFEYRLKGDFLNAGIDRDDITYEKVLPDIGFDFLSSDQTLNNDIIMDITGISLDEDTLTNLITVCNNGSEFNQVFFSPIENGIRVYFIQEYFETNSFINRAMSIDEEQSKKDKYFNDLILNAYKSIDMKIISKDKSGNLVEYAYSIKKDEIPHLGLIDGQILDNNTNILLVHGILSWTEAMGGTQNSTDFDEMKTHIEDLNDLGFEPNILKYNYNCLLSNELTGNSLAEQLNQMLEEKENATLTIIAHSNGGLVSRWALTSKIISHKNLKKIKKLIFLSTPNRGGRVLLYNREVTLQSAQKNIARYLFIQSINQIPGKTILIGSAILASNIDKLPIGIAQLVGSKDNSFFNNLTNDQTTPIPVSYFGLYCEGDFVVGKKSWNLLDKNCAPYNYSKTELFKNSKLDQYFDMSPDNKKYIFQTIPSDKGNMERHSVTHRNESSVEYKRFLKNIKPELSTEIEIAQKNKKMQFKFKVQDMDSNNCQLKISYKLGDQTYFKEIKNDFFQYYLENNDNLIKDYCEFDGHIDTSSYCENILSTPSHLIYWDFLTDFEYNNISTEWPLKNVQFKIEIKDEFQEWETKDSVQETLKMIDILFPLDLIFFLDNNPIGEVNLMYNSSISLSDIGIRLSGSTNEEPVTDLESVIISVEGDGIISDNVFYAPHYNTKTALNYQYSYGKHLLNKNLNINCFGRNIPEIHEIISDYSYNGNVVSDHCIPGEIITIKGINFGNLKYQDTGEIKEIGFDQKDFYIDYNWAGDSNRVYVNDDENLIKWTDTEIEVRFLPPVGYHLFKNAKVRVMHGENNFSNIFECGSKAAVLHFPKIEILDNNWVINMGISFYDEESNIALYLENKDSLSGPVQIYPFKKLYNQTQMIWEYQCVIANSNETITGNYKAICVNDGIESEPIEFTIYPEIYHVSDTSIYRGESIIIEGNWLGVGTVECYLKYSPDNSSIIIGDKDSIVNEINENINPNVRYFEKREFEFSNNGIMSKIYIHDIPFTNIDEEEFKNINIDKITLIFNNWKSDIPVKIKDPVFKDIVNYNNPIYKSVTRNNEEEILIQADSGDVIIIKGDYLGQEYYDGLRIYIENDIFLTYYNENIEWTNKEIKIKIPENMISGPVNIKFGKKNSEGKVIYFNYKTPYKIISAPKLENFVAVDSQKKIYLSGYNLFYGNEKIKLCLFNENDLDLTKKIELVKESSTFDNTNRTTGNCDTISFDYPTNIESINSSYFIVETLISDNISSLKTDYKKLLAKPDISIDKNIYYPEEKIKVTGKNLIFGVKYLEVIVEYKVGTQFNYLKTHIINAKKQDDIEYFELPMPTEFYSDYVIHVISYIEDNEYISADESVCKESNEVYFTVFHNN